jgi:hypothetical protein
VLCFAFLLSLSLSLSITETFFLCQQCMQIFFGIVVTSLYHVSGTHCFCHCFVSSFTSSIVGGPSSQAPFNGYRGGSTWSPCGKWLRFWALLFVFDNLFISTSILCSCWGQGSVKKEQPLELCLGLLDPSFVKSGDEIKKSGWKQVTGWKQFRILFSM